MRSKSILNNDKSHSYVFFSSKLWFKFLLYRSHQVGDRLKSPPWVSTSDSLQPEASKQFMFFDQILKFQLVLNGDGESKGSLSHEKERLPFLCI